MSSRIVQTRFLMTATTNSALSFPCPSTSLSQVLVDDMDLAHIQYADGWGLDGNKDFECNGTTHGAINGKSTTATFWFEGVGVQVFGTIGTGSSPISTFQVDNLPAYTFSLDSKAKATLYGIQYYTSPPLEPGNHTLVIASIWQGSTQMFLDYIVYNPIPNAITSTITSTLTCSATFVTAAGLSTGPQSKVISSGTLAGSVIGGTVLGLALGIFLTVIVFRKHKKSKVSPISNRNQIGI
ncbi:hypothetical protein GYMLUDRAFT_1012313 [Collybiopsis luxurians FD-317 M1]|uniref:Uncharacterized protein n=1 Tax=Collybiopsis luxurians FD-317 M1 TaxID=944289 RepID=A0A0D0CNN1_9AGAR|nr:hypothetical protein GYMLUDRAFT_1012313 [Collybiopsis luxurians FD-317 M1]